jgi:hypothetical protein
MKYWRPCVGFKGDTLKRMIWNRYLASIPLNLIERILYDQKEECDDQVIQGDPKNNHMSFEHIANMS